MCSHTDLPTPCRPSSPSPCRFLHPQCPLPSLAQARLCPRPALPQSCCGLGPAMSLCRRSGEDRSSWCLQDTGPPSHRAALQTGNKTTGGQHQNSLPCFFLIICKQTSVSLCFPLFNKPLFPLVTTEKEEQWLLRGAVHPARLRSAHPGGLPSSPPSPPEAGSGPPQPRGCYCPPEDLVPRGGPLAQPRGRSEAGSHQVSLQAHACPRRWQGWGSPEGRGDKRGHLLKWPRPLLAWPGQHRAEVKGGSGGLVGGDGERDPSEVTVTQRGG